MVDGQQWSMVSSGRWSAVVDGQQWSMVSGGGSTVEGQRWRVNGGGSTVEGDRKSTRLNSSHVRTSRMPSSARKKKT